MKTDEPIKSYCRLYYNWFKSSEPAFLLSAEQSNRAPPRTTECLEALDLVAKSFTPPCYGSGILLGLYFGLWACYLCDAAVFGDVYWVLFASMLVSAHALFFTFPQQARIKSALSAECERLSAIPGYPDCKMHCALKWKWSHFNCYGLKFLWVTVKSKPYNLNEVKVCE